MTGEVPQGIKSKTLAKVEFKTCAGASHVLFKKYNQNAKVPVEDLLKYPFVLPESALLGRVSNSASLDGWRDDKFPRQIRFRAGGLKILEELVTRGQALAYLPDYYVKEMDFISILSICPRCSGKMKILAAIEDPKVIRKILDHLGIPSNPPKLGQPRGPPPTSQDNLFTQTFPEY